MNKSSMIQLAVALGAGFVVGGAIFAVWPGGSGAEVNADTSDSTNQSAGDHAADDGRKVADFTLPDLEGEPVKFSEFAAGRPFVITFGQTTCPPCVGQSLVFKKLESKYEDKVAFLKIYIGQEPAVAAAQVKQLKSKTKTLTDLRAEIYYRYGDRSVPVTLVGDSEGRIIVVKESMIPEAELVRLLDPLLAEKDA